MLTPNTQAITCTLNLACGTDENILAQLQQLCNTLNHTMSFCPPCAICCTTCAAKQLKTPLTHAAGDPEKDPSRSFALKNLFAAGSLTIKRAPQQEPLLCDHVHADDGWHRFNGLWHSGYLTSDGVDLSANIGFLVKNDFIRATYNITSETTFTLRIYFIQNNLPGVKGTLRHTNRKYKVLNSARRYLRDLVDKVTRDAEQWYGHPPKENVPDLKTLVYELRVCFTISSLKPRR